MVEPPEKLLRELIALPSVNPAFLPPGDARAGEWRVAEYLAAQAGKAGLPAEFQRVLADGGGRPRANLVVRVGPRKAKQRILLAPHLDTVGFGDSPGNHFIPSLRNGRLYGRGACDTKGSVAAMFTALLRVAEQGSLPEKTEIIFVGLIDEENAQLGSRAFANSGLKAQLAIVGEPTECRVVTAHKGDLWLTMVTQGKAAHGSRPELGKNAVHIMARAVDLLETKYAHALRIRKHSLLGPPTVNVGVIRGGVQPNIVPDFCEIQVDRRTVPGEKDRKVEQEIITFLRQDGIPVEIVNRKSAPCPPMETDPAEPLVRQLLESTGQPCGLGAQFFCDAAIFSAAGIPSVVFGPGNIAQAHTENEWISIKSLTEASNRLTRFLQSLP